MPKPPAKTLRVIKIFIASPRDVQAERTIFRDIVNEVNEIKANSLEIALKPLGWEDTLPGKGRPQALINKDIEDCDLIIMLLWKRWGTPTGKYTSGFEEEYELAKGLNEEREGRPEILLYFRAVSEEMMADPGEQLRKVLEFRKKVETEKKFLYQPYEDEDQWKTLIRKYLCLWLDGIKIQLPKVEIPVEDLKAVTQTLAREAVKKAESGQITEADEYFAKSINADPDPNTINLYGLFLHRIGMLKRAEEKFRQVEAIGKGTNSGLLLAVAYGNLGILYQTRGDLKAAEEMFRKSLAIFNAIGSKLMVEKVKSLMKELENFKKKKPS